MNNNFVKRTVAVTTSVATTISLSGISLLAPVFVAASSHIMDGDTIKTASSPDVWIAKHVGTKKFKRLILNPQVFASYGHLSWGAIKTVSEADAAMYTMTELVRAVGDPKVYKLTSAPNSDTGEKHWMNMTAAEFVAEGYDWDSIYEINTVDRDNYTVSSDVTLVTPPPPTAAYSVALASDNPLASTLVNKSAFNKVLKVNVSAGTSAVNITSVTVERFGITLDVDISGVSVWDGAGMRHGNIATLGQKVAVLSFPSDPIMVPAGGMAPVTVAINVANSGSSGTVGMKITAMSGTPAGLPVMSNTFSLASGNSVLGAVEADINTQNTSQVTVNVGTTNQLLTKLSLGETSSNEDVWFKGVTFQQNGSAADGDVTNWKLVAPTGVTLATVANSVSKVVRFNLSASPWKIDKGTTDVFDVKVDVVNGSNRTVQAVVQNDYEIDLLGNDTNIAMLSIADITDGDDASFPIGDVLNEDTLSIGSGSLVVAKATNSPSGNVAAGAASVTLAKWELKAEGEDFEVRQVDFYFTSLVAPDNGDSGTTANEPTDVLTGSVSLVKGDGASVYSAAVSATLPATTETAVTLSSYFTIKAGVTESLSAVGNLRSDLSAADSFQFALKDVYGRRLTTSDFSTQATAAVLANSLTGQTGTLSVVKNEAKGNATVIGGTKTLLGSFILQSGSAEGVNITSIAPDLDTGTGIATTDLDSWWVEIDGVKYSQTDTTPNLTSDSFTGTFQLPASSQAVLDVYGDISSTIGNGDIFIADFAATEISGTTLQSQQSVNNGGVATGQSMTLRSAGVVKVGIGTNPVTGIHHANESGVKVMEFKITAQYEGVDMTAMRFVEFGDTQRDWTNVTLKKGTTPLGTRAPDTNGIYEFAGLTQSIAVNVTETYTLEVNTTNPTTLGAADNAIIYFQSAEIKGKDSGADILEYDSEGFGGALSVELGSTSSATHYRQGDLVVSMNNAATWGFGVVQGNENEATSTSGDGLDLGEAATETFTTSEYIAKVGGTALARAPQIGAALTGFAVEDGVIFSDASANTVTAGIVTAVTGGEPTTIDTAAVTIDGAADIVVEFGGTGFDSDTEANCDAGSDFTTDPAVGDLVYYYDDTGANDGWAVVTAFTASTTANDTVQLNATNQTVTCGTLVTDRDHYFAPTMDVTQEVHSTAAVNHYNVGDVVFHFDSSSAGSSGFGVVTTGVRAGETMANLVTSIATSATSDRLVRIAPRPLGTNTFKMHDGEPVAVANNSGISTTMSNSLQDVARFDITAQGDDLTIESITLTVFGSGADALSTATNGLEVWVGGVREFQGGDLDPVVEAGTTFVIDFTNAIDIASGQTKSFLVKLNTLGITATNETVSVKLDGTKGQDASSIDFYYGADGGPGTTPTSAAPEDINDSEFPLNGVTIIK